VRSLVLMEQGLVLHAEGELFEIRKGDVLVEKVRIGEIEEVLVFGGITLTPASVSILLARGLDTIFLTARGRYRGRLVGPVSKNVELRLLQFSKWHEPQSRIVLARGIVGGKIANQRSLLLRAQRELKSDSLAAAAAEMRRLLLSLEHRTDLDAIRGVEGQAASVYFGSFGSCIRNRAFSFTHRTRRPPRDAVNAMLSFGYTMLNLTMESILSRAGLDPMLGSFHAPDYGRPSLSLDLIEEFRPLLVDSLALRMVNRRQVTPEDFEEPPREDEPEWFEEQEERANPASEQPRAVWLGETGRRVFFREWGRRLHETVFYEPRAGVRSLEEIMRLQVYHYARVLKGEDDLYRPFIPR
jgi:CRISP-associated protein Cas1